MASSPDDKNGKTGYCQTTLFMEELRYNREELICALATGWTSSALGVIRCSGTGCVGAVARVFSRKEALTAAPGQTLLYGHIIKPDSGEKVDEVMLGVYRAPKSYTGEESVEITCHGGIPAIKAVLESLYAAGFRDAGPGEFTLRAFLNGKLDLTRAEAVGEIVSAKTDAAHKMALRRLAGSVEKAILDIKKKVLDFMSMVELQLDYPDDEVGDQELPSPDDLDAVLEELRTLSSSFQQGRLYQEGIKVALTGATNAGKSSLFNLFLKEERAIVSEIHGTTRDYLEAGFSLAGIPLSLFDTAGFRDAENPVEEEGIRRSTQVAAGADLVLHVIDGVKGADFEDEKAKHGGDPRVIFVWNKIDKNAKTPPAGALPISALTGEGLPALEKELLKRIAEQRGLHSADSDRAVIDSLRQKQLLERAYAALDYAKKGLAGQDALDGVAVDLREALDALGEITGEVTTAEILDNMFSSFCVGK